MTARTVMLAKKAATLAKTATATTLRRKTHECTPKQPTYNQDSQSATTLQPTKIQPATND